LNILCLSLQKSLSMSYLSKQWRNWSMN